MQPCSRYVEQQVSRAGLPAALQNFRKHPQTQRSRMQTQSLLNQMLAKQVACSLVLQLCSTRTEHRTEQQSFSHSARSSQVFGLHTLPSALVINYTCNASDDNTASLSWQVCIHGCNFIVSTGLCPQKDRTRSWVILSTLISSASGGLVCRTHCCNCVAQYTALHQHPASVLMHLCARSSRRTLPLPWATW
jgi:hypothetical protein